MSMGRGARLAGAIGLVVVLAGCWPAPGQGPDRRSHNPFEEAITPETVSTLAPVWTATTDEAFVPTAPGAPVVSNGGVHVSDGEALYGFDRRTGARLWRLEQPYGSYSDSTVAPPIADGGRVLFSHEAAYNGAYWGDAVWVDARTGADVMDDGDAPFDAVRGSRRAGREHLDAMRSGVTVTYIDVVDRSGSGTGWRGVVDAAGYTARTVRPVTLGAERVYVAGKFISTFPPSGPDAGVHAVRAYPFATPAVCGGDGGSLVIRCPDWSTGLDSAPATSPVIGPGESTVYVASTAGSLYALDAATGAVQWTAPLGAAPSADPALADGTLYVPLADGDLAALPADGCGAATCPVAWRADVGGAAAQPAVAGGVVLVGTRTGTPQLAAVDAGGCGATRCDPLWTHATGAAVSGAPAVTGGRVYVGLADRRVVAFALGG
jgi:outer membrane protein assembly factor BamB